MCPGFTIQYLVPKKEYNIYIYKKKGTFETIASTKVNETGFETLGKKGNNIINIVTNHIISSVKMFQDSDIPCTKKLFNVNFHNYDKIDILFLDEIKYQQCSVYFVYQHSHKTNNVRILAYATDMNQKGDNLQNKSLNDVTYNDLQQHIVSILPNKIDTLPIDDNLKQKLRDKHYILFL